MRYVRKCIVLLLLGAITCGCMIGCMSAPKGRIVSVEIDTMEYSNAVIDFSANTITYRKHVPPHETVVIDCTENDMVALKEQTMTFVDDMMEHIEEYACTDAWGKYDNPRIPASNVGWTLNLTYENGKSYTYKILTTKKHYPDDWNDFANALNRAAGTRIMYQLVEYPGYIPNAV